MLRTSWVLVVVIYSAFTGLTRELPVALRGQGTSPGLQLMVDKVLKELEDGKHDHLLHTDPKSFDNPCAASSLTMDYVPPFVCVFQLPVIAAQVFPQYSLAWVLDHANPSTLLGIYFHSTVEGDVIPEKIGEFRNLLLLYMNSVTVPLPVALSQLVNLQIFDFLEVRGGPIEMPNYDLMPHLQGIVLHNVEGRVTGSWPTFDNHTDLASVSFIKAGIQARPPDRLFQLPSLLSVNLQYNPMSHGPLPKSFSLGIRKLVLEGTAAKGEIPSALFRLTGLCELNLCINQLTGTLSSELGLLTNLERLWLGGNQLSGSIPSWLGRLTGLEELHLDNSSLGGTLPSELGLLTALRWIELSHNHIHGPLPTELRALTALTQLDIGFNQLTGPVFCLPALERVDCEDNYLTGSAPEQCRGVWTGTCDFSGLSDKHCKQRENACNPWEKQYNVVGAGCTHLALLVPVPVSLAFVCVLVVFVWSFRKERGSIAIGTGAFGWSVMFATIAALELASTWTTLLASYFELSSPAGPVACCVLLLALVLHGVTGCVLCPARGHLRKLAVVVIVVVSRQLLVEFPWRAVFAGKPCQVTDSPGQGEARQGESEGQPSRVQPASGTQRMLQFTRRAAFCQVAMNACVLVWQGVLVKRSNALHLAKLALCLGGACLFVSAALLAWHWWNERTFNTQHQHAR